MITDNYHQLLTAVGTRIKEYQKNKEATDKISATDFNFLDFFGPGENKVSEILAFFLDPYRSHGQGDRFLLQFLKMYNLENLGALKEVRCEKKTSEDRRLDIYIEFEQYVVAIENKIWAFDQNNQLRDYATFLKWSTNDKYLLLYLNPYGLDPGENSINSNDLELLKDQGKIRIMSYKKDLFGLLDSWKSCCEAEKVSHFIDQFKDYLKIKINGKNTTMTKEIRNVIYQNSDQAAVLVNTYNDLKNAAIYKINEVGAIIRTEGLSTAEETPLEGPFNYEKFRVFKAAVIYNSSKLWIQLLQDEIKVKTNFYTEDNFDQALLAYLKYNNIDNVKEEFDPELSKLIVADEFKKKVTFIRELIKGFVRQSESSSEADPINGHQ